MDELLTGSKNSSDIALNYGTRPIIRSNLAHVVGVLSCLNSQRTTGHDLCDFKLTTADNGTLFCHRGVLVACSKYFEAMFAHEDMRESVTGEVDLSQFATDVIELLLGFMYTGNINLSADNVISVVEAAQYLQMDGLVERCCEVIRQSLSHENYVDFYNHATRLFLKETENAVRKYIRDHVCLDFAKETDAQFQRLTFEQLHSIVDSDLKFTRVTGEYEIFQLIVLWLDDDATRVSRRQYVAKLLGDCVRYPLISVRDLTDHVMPYVIEIQDSDLYNTVMDALAYHLRPDQQFSHVGKKQTTQRFVKDCILTLSQEASNRLYIWEHPIEHSAGVMTSTSSGVIGANAAFAELEGFVYVAGGLINEKGVATMYRYNARSDTWFQCRGMSEGRYSFSLSEIKGKLYAVGGLSKPDAHISAIECYDPVENEWSYCSPVIGPTYGHSATVVDQQLFIAGGERGAIQCYDPVTDKWECLIEIDSLAGKKVYCEMYHINGLLFIPQSSTRSDGYGNRFTEENILRFSLNSCKCLPLPMKNKVNIISSYIEVDKLRIVGSPNNDTVRVLEYDVKADTPSYFDIKSSFPEGVKRTCRLKVPSQKLPPKVT